MFIYFFNTTHPFSLYKTFMTARMYGDCLVKSILMYRTISYYMDMASLYSFLSPNLLYFFSRIISKLSIYIFKIIYLIFGPARITSSTKSNWVANTFDKCKPWRFTIKLSHTPS